MDNRPEQARQHGDFDDYRLTCFCQPLHSGCDPKFCDKAISAPSSEWIEHDGPLKPFVVDGLSTQWENGAEDGCVTCGAVLGAGEKISKFNEEHSRGY